METKPHLDSGRRVPRDEALTSFERRQYLEAAERALAVYPGHSASSRTGLTAAALRARRLYPGALGELVDRELRSCADFGVEPGEDGLIARLAAQVLAGEGQR
jgi:hypothetical protein